MTDPAQELRNFKPAKEFFIGIDSDGCVFDSMEIKHKECFVPMFIKHFGLQPVSKYAREVWEFVNLYSKTRGVNRFPALVRSLNFLREREEVKLRNVQVPTTAALEDWLGRETKLGNGTLAQEVNRGNKSLALVKEWSDAVNRMIEDIVQGVPPFPFFRESLREMGALADTMVISQTPSEALEREWTEHGIKEGVRLIAGQEMGSKTEHLKLGVKGKYGDGRILMIGDALGDLNAAKANACLFYPIVPGVEEASWKRFHDEAMQRFFNGQYAGSYENELIKEFEANLPENPPWA
ncbi:MAG TPA: HAD family hydrolase [Candidatus Kapabacteria bacterium]|nr:HAD family hydrolase [Candidatus Kapabacteria bacterium]